MQQYDWPGNVRELQNAVHQYIALQKVDVITKLNVDNPVSDSDRQALIEELGSTHTLDNATCAFEKMYIAQLLEAHKWHRTKVAAILGIDRRTLFRKIKAYGIE